MKTTHLKFLFPWVFIVSMNHALAQIVETGIKAGYQYSWVTSDDADFRSRAKLSPVSGYNAGLVVAFKMKERYFLHTEYLFSTKGKIVSDYVTRGGKPDPELVDKITYYYIDVPLLYNVQFKGKIDTRQFKWYVGIGPLFSYWLGGKGSIKSQELREDEFDVLDYKIKFGVRDAASSVKSVYMDEAKRLQLGLTFGGGIKVEPPGRNKLMFDLRFELGGTWHGKPESADYRVPSNYDDSIRARNMGLRGSVIYLYEWNLSKKSLNKGKSTKKIKKKRR